MPVKAIPDGYDSITPYLSVRGAVQALEFYKTAFGAQELMRVPQPDGRIGHAEMQIGNARIMIADEFPEMNFRGPQSLGGTPVGLMLYVENVDDVVARAVAAGATIVQPVQDKFYGDRMGSILDPFGHSWHIATHIEDISPEELRRRAAAQKG
ncbi:MAG TPA: VOC family protein [Terriglobia bacterium]|nr:VOC family protein [Terriglobia bacterium]